MNKMWKSVNPRVAQELDRKLQQGLDFHRIGQLHKAKSIYEKILKEDPNHFDAIQLLGAMAVQNQQWEKAIQLLNSAIKINNSIPNVYNNLGNALKEVNRSEEAVASYDRAIVLQRDYAEAYCNRGNALMLLNRKEEALASYDHAISIQPAYAEAYSNRGNALLALKRLDEAVTSYDRAILLKPDCAEVYANRANTLMTLRRLDEAMESYKKAIEIKPNFNYLFGILLHTKMQMCEWGNFEIDSKTLIEQVNDGGKSSPGFPLLALSDSLATHLKASEIWMKDMHPFNTSLGPVRKSSAKEKIKIAYYSADFREHPVSYLTAELFELHNKEKFEIIAFYYGSLNGDNMQKRLLASFDKFIDIRLCTDKEAAHLSRELEIDIAVDLTGLTQDGRAGIFSFRAAPIQLSYIGYLGTISSNCYDYLIADKVIIPPDSQKYYAEKIIYLPNYQVNDSKRAISDKLFTRSELKLPENGFVFCCFNGNYKITPQIFDGWMRILSAVSGSVLFLYAENKWAEKNLKMEAEKRGVNCARLVFGARISRSEYLARYRLIDLFLDTSPYNAGTTASDALWAGLPVLTCIGESFAARVAASILSAIEVPELITTTKAEYEATAIELATNPIKLKAIRTKIENNRLTTALFDTPRFSKYIEAAYVEMHARHLADLPLEHIFIDP